MSTPSLRRQAYQAIHQWIISGKLPKGSATSEGELSRMLDMSRTPIRAALQQLEQEGYVRIAPKHGVIILDSSAQRVSDLLDIVTAFILFSVTAAWELKQRELVELAATHSQSLNTLLKTGTLTPDAMVQFEFDLLYGIIQIGRNKEMSSMFVTTISRLFWSSNHKRWKAPHHVKTTKDLNQLLAAIPKGLEPFRESLFPYLQTLKLTWGEKSDI
ncbi:GntR family transcriptional regulator [Paenibacillus sp. CC-CFT747]|nr:GntR family transcriptional regulator [Paenibacillus sp. CC-CFT747]